MDQLLKCAKFISLYLIQSKETFSSPSGQFYGFNFLPRKSIFDSVLLNLPLTLLFGWIVAGVDDEIVLAGDSSALHVVLENTLKIEMQSHKIAQRLLAKQTLSLHVDLTN